MSNMSLLDNAIEAAGGLEYYNSIKSISINASLLGSIMEHKGLTSQVLKFTLDTKAQKVDFHKFGDLFKGIYTPHRTEIYSQSPKSPTSILYNPRSRYMGCGSGTREELHYQLYFYGYAFWYYFNVPFCFKLPGFSTKELSPCYRDDGEVWRVLEIVFPDDFHTHTKVHRHYYDEEFKLRRIDYSDDLLKSGPVAHYCYDHTKVGNLLIPRFRLANYDSPWFSQNDAFMLLISSVEIHTMSDWGR
ncbi:hypothetical protein CFAM422_003466 [Trichoderma lentiforme]|uniref:Uncharacterized protein n=1 Tax=Trichoderma lentiforme TaxID=1567552 RepID=A0A9P5CDT4_9HYPO|nr:hypothetical protein CFAM422_003466 [Trichoderma lentiforme]